VIHHRIVFGAVVISIVVSLPFFGRTWHLLMHQLGAILFLGNLVVSALWMSAAKRASNADALRMGVRGIMLGDAVFTTPGALLLALNGGILGTDFFSAGANWLFIAIALFIVSGGVWIAVLLPAQRRMWRLLEPVPAGGPIPAEIEPVYRRWFRFGGIATLLPLAALVLMVYKPVM
jgi:uncharacterized membrane protein